MGLLLQQCNQNKIAEKKLAVAEHNINVLNDSLRITKNKVGEDEFNKLAFLTDKVDNLAKLSTDLANAVKNINGKVGTIIKGTASVAIHDTLFLDATTTVEDTKIVTDFNFDTTYSKGNSRHIKGWTEYDLETQSTTAALTKDSLSIAFTTGIKNLYKGKPEIFLTSTYPGFTVTDLQGAVLDPKLFQPKTKQKLLTIGLNVGYTPITYSLNKKQFSFDPTRFGASVGINVNLSRLLKRK